MKNIVTVVGIRPDFIRMSELLRKLDEKFNNILIHSGQHFEKSLSEIFFKELQIKKPDFNLCAGKDSKGNSTVLSSLISVRLLEVLSKVSKENGDIAAVIFIGDSDTILSSIAVKKAGYKVIHIGAGMRSGDKTSPEEINRIICDQIADLHFVYHSNYSQKLLKEGLNPKNIHVVGNTILEPLTRFSQEIIKKPRKNAHILLDIHRRENLSSANRLKNIIEYTNSLSKSFKKPIFLLNFPKTIKAIGTAGIGLGSIQLTPLMSYSAFLQASYDSVVLISDSGTCQDESPALRTPVIVPRSSTERSESMSNNCSILLDVNSFSPSESEKAFRYLLDIETPANLVWLGDAKTSTRIIEILEKKV